MLEAQVIYKRTETDSTEIFRPVHFYGLHRKKINIIKY